MEFQVRLVADTERNKPRGYAFIEYMHTRDMKGLIFLIFVNPYALRLFIPLLRRTYLFWLVIFYTAAYKQADGRKLDNRRVLVDVERGRTVPNWRPRRLGGGLGTTRVGGEEVNQRYSGR